MWDLRQEMSSRAEARSLVMGFSERTCLPARRDFLMNEGWLRIGRLGGGFRVSVEVWWREVWGGFTQ